MAAKSDNENEEQPKKRRGAPRKFPLGPEQSRGKEARKARNDKRKQDQREKDRRILIKEGKRKAKLEKDKEKHAAKHKGRIDDSLENGLAEIDPDRLTAKERILVENFLAYGNKRKANVAAGFNPGANDPWEREGVLNVIKRELAERREKFKITSEGTLEKLSWLLNFDPALLFRPDGSPIPLNQLPIHVRYCIDGLEVEDVYAGRGRDRLWVGHLLKYKYSPKMQAIIASMKHQKLLDGSGSTHTDRLEEVLNAFRNGPVKPPQPVLEGEVTKCTPTTIE